MPQKIEVSIDELLSKRKDIADENGAIYKAHIAPRSWNEQERSATFVMSAETEDSYRDIVVQAGIDTKSRFEDNPVALFGHKSWATPIGSWSDVRRINGSPKRTEGKLAFTAEGIDEDADKVARHVAGGTIRAASIGFMPKAAERILDDKGEWTYGYKYLEVEIFECSVVTVPAVREALIRGAGSKIGDIVSPEVVEEFLEHLKANPGLAKMIKADLYEQVYREATGNKTLSIGSDLGRLESIAERIEKATGPRMLVISGTLSDDDLAKIKTAAGNMVLEPASAPVIDEVAKALEDSVEAAIKEIEPKVAEIPEEQVERKGALSKLLDGIRAIFKSEEVEKTDPVIEPTKADAATKEALRKQFDEIASRHELAA